MKETIARPYAEAVYAQAAQESALDSWSETLELLGAAVTSPDMQAVIDNPKYTDAQCEDVVLSVLSAASDTQKNFVKLLVKNKRLAVVDAVAEQFEALRAAHENQVQVEVVSAYALSESELAALQSSLEKKFSGSVAIETQVDESLLGGVVIRAGDMVIDNSVRTQMEQFSNNLAI